MNQAHIVQLIIDVINDLDFVENPDDRTPLYGEKSGLDSLKLVTLITEVEEKISEDFDIEITLANERAMSQTRSPFRRVETLAGYALELMSETNDQ